MSRSALSSHDRETFIKSQISSCHKALNKTEAPLKQKHARVLIVGTHRERSATVFWNTILQIALEKNPIVTWKFCHLLHKLIRDGHRNVTHDSYRYCSRIKQLGDFWQHLRSSGYGSANHSYCQLLSKRLEFHHNHGSIPGSFELTPAQITVLSQNPDEAFELAIDLLDLLDSLLELKTAVTSTMDSLRWSSLILQGQCLLAPLVLVIIDTSKIYDIIVKILFSLHAMLPADVLAGHRSRFNAAFRGLKKFYDDASGLQYFTYLISMPTLPSEPPNFLNAHGLDTYQTPQAYLHSDNMSSEGGDSPIDARSEADDNLLVDLDFVEPSMQESVPVKDAKDSRIEQLEAEVLMLQQSQQKLVNEAKSRIEAYESRLLDLNTDRDHWKDRHMQLQDERNRVHETLVQSQQNSQTTQELTEKLNESEGRFQKLKEAYTTFRAEHLQALQDIAALRKRNQELEEIVAKQEAEIRALKEQLSASEEARRAAEELAATHAATIEELQLAMMPAVSSDIDPEMLGHELENEMDRINQAIADAVKLIEDIQRRSRESATGARLKVNDKILDACNDLICAIRVLVIRSRDVQEEIVEQGKGTASPSEFYKRNHQWTEGLLSAAKAVGGAATYLVKSADDVVSNDGKFEGIIIAAQEVGASVAQLYVSSRVKADKDSRKMAELGTASTTVRKCTGDVVAAVKSGQLDLADANLDFTNLSLHDAKKQEMESQVRTLELEAELEKERRRLAELRKQHYHLASLVSANQNGNE